MPGSKQWRQSIRPRIAAAQRQLRDLPIATISVDCGANRRETDLELLMFANPLRITVPDYVVIADDGARCPEEIQALVLDYLVRMTGSDARDQEPGHWLGFQELPGGAFYAQAFRSYSSDVLVRELNGEAEAFREAANRLGGTFLEFGDVSASFRAFPRVRLAVVWWEGDEEFPANASVLFDSSGSHALPIDGFATLGRLLCQALLQAADTVPRPTDRTIEPPSGTLVEQPPEA